MIKWGALCALLIAIVAGGVGGAVAYLLGNVDGATPDDTQMTSATAGMDYIDAFSCPKGLVKEVQLHGVEDNFSREGDEKAVPRDALMSVTAIKQMAEEEIPNSHLLRDYDERGVDKYLLDHFAVEPGVISGELVFSSKALSGGQTDSIFLGDRNAKRGKGIFTKRMNFYVNETRKTEEGFDGFFAIDFTELVKGGAGPSSTFLQFLNSSQRPLEIDFTVSEDTMVDFAALLICRQPSPVMGTGLTTAPELVPGTDLSYLACGWDYDVPLCVPFSGHLQCDREHQIACYKEGDRKPPNDVDRGLVNIESFVPGDIKFTPATRPDRFSSLGDASDYCRAEFGKNWRVLSFHEAGGGAVLTYSKLEPNSTGLVNVADMPYGNCWDRPESVIDK